MNMRKPRRVILMTWPDAVQTRGFRRYTETSQCNWTFELQPPHDKMLGEIEANPPDGVIAYLGVDFYARWAASQPFPFVNHSSALRVSPVPRVCIDDYAAGRLAAEHLYRYGHRNLAFVGHATPWFSKERWRGFSAFCSEFGVEAKKLELAYALTPASRNRSVTQDKILQDYIADLPTPTGLFACNDSVSLQAVEAARLVGRRIPDTLAVLGMDNEPLSQLASPPLSSIVSPFDQVAFSAARMLDQLMDGRPPDDLDQRIPLRKIEVRQSSNALAVDDPAVAKAMRFIREQFNQAIGVDDLALAAGVNRRTLESRFKATLGISPGKELKRFRLEHARMLLSETDLLVDEVAARSGFDDTPWFTTLFKKEVGQSPGQYRKNRDR